MNAVKFNGRASKPMMLAVNAMIDGNAKEADEIIEKQNLDREQVLARVEYRKGKKYDLSNGKRSKTLLAMLDENTPIYELLQLIETAQQLLGSKHPDQVDEVERAIIEEAELVRQLEEVREKKQAA